MIPTTYAYGRPIDPALFIVRSWDFRGAMFCAYPCAGRTVLVIHEDRWHQVTHEPLFHTTWAPIRPPFLTAEQEEAFFDGLRLAKLELMRRLMGLGQS